MNKPQEPQKETVVRITRVQNAPAPNPKPTKPMPAPFGNRRNG